ncbi:hypothetical protein DYB35_012446 [Aphanomyces astaci]|uniref:Prolyl endopeptidase n=1 Tax=Aphanomyces astaci TaxID=112090 RepID=A0A418CLS7_APHAT|nr:hypothetical protein DYB35_012446 [Aphanomyces astaci]
MTVTVSLTPPVLEKRPKMVPYGKVPGENRGEQPMEPIIYLEDPYYYVRDDSRSNTEILDHLKAENAYTKAALSHLDGLQDELYKELLSHVQETDQMVPYPHGNFVYYTRTEEGKAYHIHCRQPRHDVGAEEILLDVNKLAEGHAHCGVRSVEVSPDHKLLAYSVDLMAYETYDIYIKDLTTNTISKAVEGCNGTIVWGRDTETLFYVTQDAAHRSHKVWSHLLGAPQSDDTSLFTEDDEMFYADVFKTSSGRSLLRTLGVQYTVEHWQNELLISTNRDGDVNFKLMSVPLHIVLDKQKAAHNSQWTSVFAYDPTVKVESVICFESFIVLKGRQDGLTQRWICGKDTNNSTWHKTRLPMPEAIYSLGTAKNAEYATTKYRYTYSSLTTPLQTVEYDFISNKTVILKETPVPHYDRYEAAKYLTKMTTFTDFIACAEHLVATKVTSPSHMTCEGGSAGGLLVGAVLNMRPDLFTAVVAGVPFVDVMNSMSDATIPLTTIEWAEWGNPNELKYFAYMLQYSPYDNVKAQAYPNLLVTGGLFDPRVAYWEPTKWVAKLRDLKTDNNQVLLKMNLDAGHFSASDRYHVLKEKAVRLSFVLDQLKCLEK